VFAPETPKICQVEGRQGDFKEREDTAELLPKQGFGMGNSMFSLILGLLRSGRGY
jgi:hypothetical protein